jgi:DNA repair exonuclease SbcCD ATPase subunit
LDRKIKEGESNITSMENRENALNGQVETLEVKLAAKSALVKHLAELEKIGLDSERLRQLEEALKEIGMRHGLRGQQTVDKFFDGLKDYESVLGAELQLKGFQTQIEIKKLEAENWQAKEEALRRKHNDLQEALGAVHALRTRGIKASQIITWHQILNRFQKVEQLAESLAQYGDMAELLKSRKEEAKNCELRLAKAQSQVETLEKERAKIEGAIDVLKVAGVKELKAMTEEATKQLKTLANREINEIREIGQEVRTEFSDFFTRLDASVEKVFEMGQKFERIRQELHKYEGIKDALEPHAASSEEEK